VIQSWKSEALIAVFAGSLPKAFPAALFGKTRRLLAQLNAAASPEDMRAPPGNRLHQLSGDKGGLWSISVNMQYRITFFWLNGHAYDVWFGDYH
jgi:toxin HigB-1